ncbi:MAG TPA: glutathione peroxidase [Micavibrio sp.]
MSFAILAGFLALLGLSAPAHADPANTGKPGPQTAHHFAFKTIVGAPLFLSDFKNKVVLVVNTASRCGFTPQYEGLQNLYNKYKDQGLVVLGVPSNDFGGQEPGSHKEIKEFCAMNFGITFPMTEKEIVSGKDAHPFYKWAAQQGKGNLLTGKPRWNFHKYLIAADGKLAGSFAPTTKPESESFIKAVEAELAKIHKQD